MIRIQRLKEPKKGISGEEIKPGEKVEFRGMEIKNTTKHSWFCSWYKRPGADLINRKKRSKEATKRREKLGDSLAKKSIQKTV